MIELFCIMFSDVKVKEMIVMNCHDEFLSEKNSTQFLGLPPRNALTRKCFNRVHPNCHGCQLYSILKIDLELK